MFLFFMRNKNRVPCLREQPIVLARHRSEKERLRGNIKSERVERGESLKKYYIDILRSGKLHIERLLHFYANLYFDLTQWSMKYDTILCRTDSMHN